MAVPKYMLKHCLSHCIIVSDQTADCNKGYVDMFITWQVKVNRVKNFEFIKLFVSVYE